MTTNRTDAERPATVDLVERARKLTDELLSKHAAEMYRTRFVEKIVAALAAEREDATRRALQAGANVALAVSSRRANAFPRFAIEGKDEALGCGEEIHDAIRALSLPNTTAETGDER